MLNKEVLYITILISLMHITLCIGSPEKFEGGYEFAQQAVNIFFALFGDCAQSTMPSQRFLMDDLKSFVNFPSKTTVGFAPKFTNNRKFFANMIGTIAFKEMLSRDEEELRQNFIKKLKYCDDVVMDENTLKDFYAREVDPTKI